MLLIAIAAISSSVNVNTGMVILLLISALVFPIVFLLNLTPSMQILIVAVAFAFAILGIGGLIFVPKLIILVPGHDIEGLSGGVKTKEKKPNGSGKVTKGGATAFGAAVAVSTPAGCDAGSTVGTGELLFASSDLKRKSFAEKVQICRAQVEQWTALLVRTEQGFSESRSGASRSAASSVFEPQLLQRRSADSFGSQSADNDKEIDTDTYAITGSMGNRSPQLNDLFRSSVSHKTGNGIASVASVSFSVRGRVLPVVDHSTDSISLHSTACEPQVQARSSSQKCWHECHDEVLTHDPEHAVVKLDGGSTDTHC